MEDLGEMYLFGGTVLVVFPLLAVTAIGVTGFGIFFTIKSFIQGLSKRGIIIYWLLTLLCVFIEFCFGNGQGIITYTISSPVLLFILLYHQNSSKQIIQ